MPYLLILCFVSLLASANPGTMSTDLTPASEAEASLSGTTDRADELMTTEEERQQQEAEEDMTMEDASSVEFDPDDEGVEKVAPPIWE